MRQPQTAFPCGFREINSPDIRRIARAYSASSAPAVFANIACCRGDPCGRPLCGPRPPATWATTRVAPTDDPARSISRSCRRPEASGARHLPGFVEARIVRAVEQLTRPQGRIELVETQDLARRHPAGEMRRDELARMVEAGGGDQLGQRLKCRRVEILHANPFVVDDQSALAARILRRNADRAPVGMAALGLDAAEREHESARRVAPVRAERHGAGDVKGRNDLAAGAEPDAVAGIDADERVVNEIQPFPQRHAEMIDELQRRSAGAAFLAVDDDKVRIDAGLQYRLAHREEFPRMPDAELESGRLAARQPPHLADELHHSDRRREAGMAGRRYAVLAP